MTEPIRENETITVRDSRIVNAQALLHEARDLARKIGDAIPGSASEMGALAAELASAHDDLYSVENELRAVRSPSPGGDE